MKQLISLLVFAGFFYSSAGIAAKKPTNIKAAKIQKIKTTKTQKVKTVKKTALVKSSKKSIEKKIEKAVEKTQWNDVCQDLLSSSILSTLDLEKSIQKKKKLSKNELESKVQNELMVVQLNAWVCAQASKSQVGVAAEELFLRDYSKMVRTQKL